jgi:hypothetical protein
MDDRKVRTEKITIVALITDPAIETPFGLMHRDIVRNPQIDFIEVPDPLVAYKSRLRHPVSISKITCIDLLILDDVTVSLTAGPTHVCFHRKRYTVPDSAGFEFREDGIGPLPKQRIERHGGLLPGSDGVDDTLYIVEHIATVKKRRRPVFLNEGTISEIQDARA